MAQRDIAHAGTKDRIWVLWLSEAWWTLAKNGWQHYGYKLDLGNKGYDGHPRFVSMGPPKPPGS